MNTLSTFNTVLAVVLGLITAFVSWRVLNKAMGIRNLLLAKGVGTLAGVGLANLGGDMTTLLIPYGALAVAVVVMLFLAPFLTKTKNAGKKRLSPQDDRPQNHKADDPWEKEIRNGGKLANRFRVRRRS